MRVYFLYVNTKMSVVFFAEIMFSVLMIGKPFVQRMRRKNGQRKYQQQKQCKIFVQLFQQNKNNCFFNMTIL
jgi:membrane protein implicated in regulation of membrane protease activity